MNNQNIIYIQYARKSSEGEDRQALSIPGQLKDNSQVIDRNHLKVVDTITDEASASIPFNRPGYTDMIRRIKKGEASGIVVWHVNRLIRNPLEEGEFKWLLQTGVIKSIWTPTREYRSEDNALLFSIEASMASQYSRDLSVNVKRGIKQQNENGHPAGLAPFGYLNTKFQLHGTNYVNEDPIVFPVLRKGFDLMLTGAYTVKEIGKILYKKYGLVGKIGLPISKNTLYRIFTNPFYYGYFVRRGNLYKGNYKPLVTIEEYDQVQVILGRRSKPRRKKHSFPYTGFIRCGSCGCAITVTKKEKRTIKTGEMKSYVFYHCTKRKKTAQNCIEKNYTTEKELESMIIQELQHYTLAPAFKDWAMEYYRVYYQDEIRKRRALAVAENNQEKKLEHELDNLIDLRIAGSISEDKFNNKKIEKEQLLLRVREKKNEFKNNDYDWVKIVEDCLDFAVGSVETFSNGDEKTKKKICLQFGSNWILKGKKLFIDKPKWLIPIKNIREICDSVFGRFEPNNTLVEYDFNPLIDYFKFHLSSLRTYTRNNDP